MPRRPIQQTAPEQLVGHGRHRGPSVARSALPASLPSCARAASSRRRAVNSRDLAVPAGIPSADAIVGDRLTFEMVEHEERPRVDVERLERPVERVAIGKLGIEGRRPRVTWLDGGRRPRLVSPAADRTKPAPPATTQDQPTCIHEDAIGPAPGTPRRTGATATRARCAKQRFLERVGDVGRIAQDRRRHPGHSPLAAPRSGRRRHRRHRAGPAPTSRSDTPPPCRSPPLTPSEYGACRVVHSTPARAANSRGVCTGDEFDVRLVGTLNVVNAGRELRADLRGFARANALQVGSIGPTCTPGREVGRNRRTRSRSGSIENGGSGTRRSASMRRMDEGLGPGGALQALLEPLDLAGRVDDRLLAREERVAVRADVDPELGAGRARRPTRCRTTRSGSWPGSTWDGCRASRVCSPPTSSVPGDGPAGDRRLCWSGVRPSQPRSGLVRRGGGCGSALGRDGRAASAPRRPRPGSASWSWWRART